MTVKLLTKHHLEFLSLKGAAQTHLNMSKCHIVVHVTAQLYPLLSRMKWVLALFAKRLYLRHSCCSFLQEAHHHSALDQIFSADRQSMLAEIRDLRAHATISRMHHQEERERLNEKLANAEDHGSKKERQLKRQGEDRVVFSLYKFSHLYCVLINLPSMNLIM